jgi:small subunit ribosomal protein S2
MQSDLQVEVGLKRKEFLQQEARVYYRVYKEIETEVTNFSERNGIHIIDLQKTIAAVKSAYDIIRHTVLSQRAVLFVGTKKQAQQAVEREARRCGMFFVNNRWLGGMLTNFATIKKSLQRLKKIEKMEVDGTFENLTKKEIARFNKERSRLKKTLGGIKEMKDCGHVFIIGAKESIAVTEARKVNVPQLQSRNHSGNDDAIRAITCSRDHHCGDQRKEWGLRSSDAQEEKGEEGSPRPSTRVSSPRSQYDQEEVEKVPVAGHQRRNRGSGHQFLTGLLELQPDGAKKDERATSKNPRSTEQAARNGEGRWRSRLPM